MKRIDGWPTEPGWYWCHWRDEGGSTWPCLGRVTLWRTESGKVCVFRGTTDQEWAEFYENEDGESCVFFGPLTPPEYVPRDTPEESE